MENLLTMVYINNINIMLFLVFADFEGNKTRYV